MKKQKNKKNNDNKINLDNEIIIGLTPKKEESSKKKVKSKKKSISKNKTNSVKKEHKKNKNKYEKVNKPIQKKKTTNVKVKKKIQKKSQKSKLIKWTILLILLVLCIVLFLLSSVFNVKNIVVNGNNKIAKEEIISLSKLQINENMFKTINSKIKENLKSNPYVDDVKIKKSLKGTITLDVKERTVTYMLTYANAYVYINNQGYILELSDTPLEVPTIVGTTTSQENIKEGNRLVTEDLEKLDTVIKIMATCKTKGIDTVITGIDISNSQDYILTIASELKTVHFGDFSEMNEKVMWIQECIERKKGIEGEIFVNNLKKNAYFRSKV